MSHPAPKRKRVHKYAELPNTNTGTQSTAHTEEKFGLLDAEAKRVGELQLLLQQSEEKRQRTKVKLNNMRTQYTELSQQKDSSLKEKNRRLKAELNRYSSFFQWGGGGGG